MASSQQREPFGAWPESSRVSESFHVRPGASGDGPRYVVGVEPRGHVEDPILSAHGEGAGLALLCVRGSPE